MKKILFQITGEEIDESHIQNELKISCSTQDELDSVCESICKAFEENQTFREAFHAILLPRLIQRTLMEIRERKELYEIEDELPDFDEIVKNAKINPKSTN